MRILIVVSAFPAISETFILRHVLSVAQRGHEVYVLAVPRDLAMLDNDDARAASIEQRLLAIQPSPGRGLLGKLRMFRALPLDPRSLKLAWLSLVDSVSHRSGLNVRLTLDMPKALAGAPRFDVIHAQHGRSAMSAARLLDAGFLKGPLVVTFHGTDLNAKRKRPNREIYGPVWRRARLCTVGSDFMARHMREVGLQRDRYRVLPVGLDTSVYRRARPTPTEPPHRLLFIGRLMPVKGAEYAIRAMPTLLGRGLPVVLELVGDGDLKASLVALTRELGVADHVVFHGSMPAAEVRPLIERSTLLVHPGIVDASGACEAQGLVLAEAQAMETPIVASRVGGIPESVRDGETALLVPEKDPDAIADAVAALLQDPERARRMGEAGRRYALKKFDQNRLADQWVEIYSNLVDSNSARTS